MSGSSGDGSDAYQLGTPVAIGSDNFTSSNPSGCSQSTSNPTIAVSGSNVFPSPGCIYINSGGTLTFINLTVLTFDIQVTPGVFTQASATLANGSVKIVAQSVSIARGGTIIVTERASGTKTYQDVVVCAAAGSSC